MEILSVFVSFNGEFHFAPLLPISNPFFDEPLENFDEKLP
jgi:hypothetical protein